MTNRQNVISREEELKNLRMPVRVTKYIQIVSPVIHDVSVSMRIKNIEKDSQGNEIITDAKFCDLKILHQFLINNGFFPIPIHQGSLIHAMVSKVYYTNQLDTNNINQLIIEVFNKTFWEDTLKIWENIPAFIEINGSVEKTRHAINLYFQKEFYASIPLSVSLWEPILRKILDVNNIKNSKKPIQIREKVFDLLRKKDNSDCIIKYLETYAWATTKNAPIDVAHPVRNDVAHAADREVNQKTALNAMFVVFYLLDELRLMK